jgi:hypothetical protein
MVVSLILHISRYSGIKPRFSYFASQCQIGVLRLSGSFRKESAEFLLNVFTFAFWAARLMFVMLANSEHFNEFVAAVFTMIFIGWHGCFLLSLR